MCFFSITPSQSFTFLTLLHKQTPKVHISISGDLQGVRGQLGSVSVQMWDKGSLPTTLTFMSAVSSPAGLRTVTEYTPSS